MKLNDKYLEYNRWQLISNREIVNKVEKMKMYFKLIDLFPFCTEFYLYLIKILEKDEEY